MDKQSLYTHYREPSHRAASAADNYDGAQYETAAFNDPANFVVLRHPSGRSASRQ